MSFMIRRARISDAKAYLSLVRALAEFEKLEPPSPAAAKRLVKDTLSRTRKARLLLAFSNRRPVAYGLYFFTYSSFLAQPTLYLEDIFVLQEFRGLGIGKSLFLKLVKEAETHGCGRMEWAVLDWNKKAIGFYEHIGAKRLREWNYYRLDQKTIRALAEKKKAK